MSKMNKACKCSFELSRIVAIVLAAVGVLMLVLPLTVLNNGEMQAKWLGVIVASSSGTVGFFSIIARFGFIGLMLAAAVLSVLFVVDPKKFKKFLPLASLLFMIGCGAYSLAAIALSLAVKSFAIDAFTFVLSFVSLGWYCQLISKKLGDCFLDNLCQLGLTLAFSILAILACGTILGDKSFGFVGVLLAAIVAANLVYECVYFDKLADLKIDRYRCFGEIGAGVVVFVFTLIADSTISGILLSLLSIAFALGQFEFIAIREKRYKDNPPALVEEVEVEEEPVVVEEAIVVEAPVVEEPVVEEQETEKTEDELTAPEGECPFGKAIPYPMTSEVENMENNKSFDECKTQYAEACPYEGGPVDGVVMAEEINPIADNAATADYDFYNCRSFDPFIATLDTQERNQFTELFILKYKGVMPEIPDYVVGGDNKEFFNKIFIYLGQYRDRIPSNLLNKIYTFAIKL